MSQEEKNNQEENNNSSVIDEALIDAEKIQNFIKENTKDMLRSTVNEEVQKSLKGSLNEDEDDEYEEEEVEDEEEDEGEDEEGGEEEITLGDEEGGVEDYASDSGEEDYTEEPAGEEDYSDIGDEETDMDMGGEEDTEDTFDLTNASDEDVINVYKQLKGDDQVEVVSQDEVKLTDDESGQEYSIRLGDEGGEEEVEFETEEEPEEEPEYEFESEHLGESEEPVYEIELEDEDEEDINEDKPRKAGHDPQDQAKGATAGTPGVGEDNIEKVNASTDTDNHGDNLQGGFPEDEATKSGAGHHADHVMEDGDEDIDLDTLGEELGDEEVDVGEEDINEEENTNPGSGAPEETHEMGEESSATEETPGDERVGVAEEEEFEVDDEGEEDTELEEEYDEVDENSVRAYNNGRNQSAKPQNFPKQRMGGRDKHFQQARGIGEDHKKLQKKYNKLLGEAKKLKKENKKFKESLLKFKEQLAETAVFNSNLTYATKLMMEHSVTGQEKEKIIERFDKEANTLDESKKLYKTIDSELKNKTSLNETVKNKIETQAGSGSSNGQLNETNAYTDKKEFGRMKELMGL